MFMSSLLMWLSLLTLLIVVFWIWFLGVWVFLTGFVGFFFGCHANVRLRF